MNITIMDKGWQELQSRVERLQGKHFGGYQQEIEYKPKDVLYLLEMPLQQGEERSETN